MQKGKERKGWFLSHSSLRKEECLNDFSQMNFPVVLMKRREAKSCSASQKNVWSKRYKNLRRKSEL
jgi:hypothetical protein